MTVEAVRKDLPTLPTPPKLAASKPATQTAQAGEIRRPSRGDEVVGTKSRGPSRGDRVTEVVEWLLSSSVSPAG